MQNVIYTIIGTILNLGLVSNSYAESKQYRVVIDNLWSTATHGQLPPQAHFSLVGGGTHNSQADFWSVGQLASPGMVRMAETGATDILRREIEAQRFSGNADADINENHWFCPPEISAPNCGPNTFYIDVDSDLSLIHI